MQTSKAFTFVPGLASNTFLASIIVVFVSALAYSYSILTFPKAYYSGITIAFLVSLLCVLIFNLAKILRAEEEGLSAGLPVLVFYALALHSAMILGFYLSGRPEAALWVADSYSLHIPNAASVADFIRGKAPLSYIGNLPFQKFFLSQVAVGLSFSFMGVTPAASAVTLMLAKLATIVVIFNLGKTIANEKVGLISASLYAFSPTVLYYTTVFYKEALVQLLVAVVLLASLKIFLKPGSWRHWIILICSLPLLINERFYLFFIFAFTFVALLPIKTRLANKPYFWGIFAIVVSGFLALFNAYSGWVNMAFGYNLIGAPFSALKALRSLYYSYADVTLINSTIPYPVAFIKILFTPFFTMNKFSIFSDYSYIIIWGSFFGQAIMLLALFGMYKTLKSDFLKNCLLIMPYFLFLCVFAYVAPYNGRLRDSFYPIIVVYAAYAISKLYAALPSSGSKAGGLKT